MKVEIYIKLLNKTLVQYRNCRNSIERAEFISWQQIFWNCKNNKDSWMVFLSRCFENSNFHWCLRVLSNINYKFYYYYFFYLSSFEKRRVLYVSRKTENVMNILKLILTTASTLRSLNYSFITDEIILIVNFSLKK